MGLLPTSLRRPESRMWARAWGSAGSLMKMTGMGVCCFDYDNDGHEDVYVADMWTAAGKRISAQEVFQKDASEEIRALYRKHAMGNSLFRNKSDGAFEDVTTRV